MAHIKIGTRASALALAQADAVAQLLRELGHTAELVPIKTCGDHVLDRPLHEIGSKGLFTEELERALLSNAVDVAVHSLKDLPTELTRGLKVVAYMLPEDRRDVIITGGSALADLRPGTVVGTSSLRRAAFIRAWRPDLEIAPIRGNLLTRLEKWQKGQVDALVLAAAGLLRMGRGHLITEYLDPERIVPSPGQGILAVEVGQHRSDLMPIAAALNDEPLQVIAQTERAVLHELGSGCQVPLGAYAAWTDADHMRVIVQAASCDGRKMLRRTVECTRADSLAVGHALGRYLKSEGALALIAEMEGG